MRFMKGGGAQSFLFIFLHRSTRVWLIATRKHLLRFCARLSTALLGLEWDNCSLKIVSNHCNFRTPLPKLTFCLLFLTIMKEKWLMTLLRRDVIYMRRDESSCNRSEKHTYFAPWWFSLRHRWRQILNAIWSAGLSPGGDTASSNPCAMTSSRFVVSSLISSNLHNGGRLHRVTRNLDKTLKSLDDSSTKPCTIN